jgi:hypothetical protein
MESDMAKGKEIGEFSHRFTSVTWLPGPAGSTLAQVNWEGTATGFGTVLSTTTFTHGKSGTFSFNGAAFLENGDMLTGVANGGFESIGVNRWKTTAVVHVSDGSKLGSEGEIDLAKRTWSGKLFEWT